MKGIDLFYDGEIPFVLITAHISHEADVESGAIGYIFVKPDSNLGWFSRIEAGLKGYLLDAGITDDMIGE